MFFKITIPDAIQLQASAVAWKRCRRFWGNLVPDLRFSSPAWVSGLLALLVVAVSPASAQNPFSLVLEPTPGDRLTVVEGEEKSYNVRLSARPFEMVFVGLTIDSNGDGGVPPFDFAVGSSSLLFFTTSNWHIDQMVTILAADDDVHGHNSSAGIVHRITVGDTQEYTDVYLPVTVLDNDVEPVAPTVALSLVPKKVNEGYKGELIVTARLEGGGITTNTPLNLAELPDEFTLDTSGGSASQTISVGGLSVSWTVVADVGTNTILGDTRSVTFSVTTTASDVVIMPAKLKLKIVDASEAQILVSTSSMTVREDSGSSSYRVSLTSQPSDTVHVTVSIEGYDSENSQIHLDDGGAVGTLTLVFHSGNWEGGQDVDFVVTGNDYSGENREETIIHSASDGGYDGAQLKILRVVVTNSEDTSTIVLSLNTEKLPEGHKGQLAVTARLGGISQMDTDLTLVLPDGFILDTSVSAATQTQTILAGDISVNWTLRADVGTNTILGDTRSVTFTVTTEADLDVSPATLKIVDASPAEIVVSSSPTVSEDSGISSYTVSLSSRPTDTVVVTVRIDGFSADSNIYLLGGENSHTLMLRFHPSDWNSAGVFVRGDVFVEIGVTDNIYWGKNQEEAITHSASDGGYDGAQLKILRVVVTDNEDTPTILLSLNTEKLSEGDKELLLVTARLEGISQMDTDLTLVLPGEEFTVNEGIRAQKIFAGVIVSTAIWLVDADVGTNTILGDTRTVIFSVTTAPVLAVVPVNLKIVDASLAEIVVSSSLTVSEETGNSSYRVSLSSRPTDTVVVTVRIDGFSADSNIYLLGGENSHTLMLRFHPSDWNSAGVFVRRDVFVEIGVIGNDYSGENREETIIHSAEGRAYDGAGEKRLPVVVTDDEEAAVRVSMTMSVLSGTEADDFVVALIVHLVDSNDEVVMLPEGGETPVTFEVSPGEAAEDYTVVFSGPTTVQIPSTGVRSVSYTLALIRDFIDEEDETFTITAKVAGLSDGAATFTIIDHPEDVRGIEIGTIADLREGSDGVYTVVLKSRPTEPVTVTFSTTSDEVTLSPSSLVFSTTNWGTLLRNIDISAMDNLHLGWSAECGNHVRCCLGWRLRRFSVASNDCDHP